MPITTEYHHHHRHLHYHGDQRVSLMQGAYKPLGPHTVIKACLLDLQMQPSGGGMHVHKKFYTHQKRAAS